MDQLNRICKTLESIVINNDYFKDFHENKFFIDPLSLRSLVPDVLIHYILCYFSVHNMHSIHHYRDHCHFRHLLDVQS